MRLKSLLFYVATVLVVAWVYAPAADGAMLRIDDLLSIPYAKGYGPFTAFVGIGQADIWTGGWFYRPGFELQMWVLYRLFGVNYSGYQWACIVMHVVATALLAAALYRVTRHRVITALIAILWAVHPMVSALVVWPSDAAVWVNLAAVGVFWWTTRGHA